jgi:hypothetical protein
MLSLKEGGRKIARIKGGKHDKKYLYLHDDEKFRTLSKDFFAKYKTLKKGDVIKLSEAVKYGMEPEDEKLNSIYEDAMRDVRKTARNGFRITDGKLIPLPNKKVVEKIYISAPSGAGKSTWCGNYIKEVNKMYKDEEVFVLSTITEDEALDKHHPIRIELSEEILEEPISPEEIQNSTTIFDDVDTIRDPKIRANICGLRDWLLEQGRHFNVRMLMTSHQLMNYKSTRILLNEATAVVFFPRCGSAYSIKRYLKLYGGLEPKQIKRILNLPSRWVALYKTYPMYILYEKGAYLLSNEDD